MEQDQDDEVQLMQKSVGLTVVTRMSIQLQALLKHLNALTPKEAHEKASALLRRLHHRYPRALFSDRPIGVEELGQRSLLEVDNSGMTWYFIFGHFGGCVTLEL